MGWWGAVFWEFDNLQILIMWYRYYQIILIDNCLYDLLFLIK